MRPVAAFVCLSLVAALPLRAELTGVIRIAGNPELAGRVSQWAEAFQRQHPAVRVETHLTGSLDCPGRSPALGVFVHRDNPLRSLTLAQLEAVFGTEHRRSAGNLRTWGELGLGGEWADRPISLYAPDAMSGTGRFFRHAVLGDSRMMNWEALTEFSDAAESANSHDAGSQIRAALARDRFGMAVAPFDLSDDRVRPLGLAVEANSVPVQASRATLISREYPLTRAVIACCNRPTGAPLDPMVREFLKFVLSAEGQKEQGDRYLPLSSRDAARQLATLE